MNTSTKIDRSLLCLINHLLLVDASHLLSGGSDNSKYTKLQMQYCIRIAK